MLWDAGLCRGEGALLADPGRVHALEDDLAKLGPSLASLVGLLHDAVLPSLGAMAPAVAAHVQVLKFVQPDCPQCGSSRPIRTGIATRITVLGATQDSLHGALRDATNTCNTIMDLTALLPAPMPGLADAAAAPHRIQVTLWMLKLYCHAISRFCAVRVIGRPSVSLGRSCLSLYSLHEYALQARLGRPLHPKADSGDLTAATNAMASTNEMDCQLDTAPSEDGFYKHLLLLQVTPCAMINLGRRAASWQCLHLHACMPYTGEHRLIQLPLATGAAWLRYGGGLPRSR